MHGDRGPILPGPADRRAPVAGRALQTASTATILFPCRFTGPVLLPIEYWHELGLRPDALSARTRPRVLTLSAVDWRVPAPGALWATSTPTVLSALAGVHDPPCHQSMHSRYVLLTSIRVAQARNNRWPSDLRCPVCQIVERYSTWQETPGSSAHGAGNHAQRLSRIGAGWVRLTAWRQSTE
jgi:hypothetical protein